MEPLRAGYSSLLPMGLPWRVSDYGAHSSGFTGTSSSVVCPRWARRTWRTAWTRTDHARRAGSSSPHLPEPVSQRAAGNKALRSAGPERRGRRRRGPSGRPRAHRVPGGWHRAGPALPERAMERLFEPFSASSSKGGAGLGLSIARELARAMGGDVTLSETSASGAVFKVVLKRS